MNKLLWLWTCVISFPYFPLSDKEWSKQLNYLLDNYKPTEVRSCTCRLGSVEVWISNWPYAYGGPYSPFEKWLPDIKTRLRLKEVTEPLRREALKKSIERSREILRQNSSNQ